MAESCGNNEGCRQSGGFRAIVRNHQTNLVPGLWPGKGVEGGPLLAMVRRASLAVQLPLVAWDGWKLDPAPSS